MGSTIFFRASSEELGREIYPGDTVPVLSVHYYMDRDIYYNRYYNRGDLLARPVRVTLYRQGHQPVMVERLFDDFVIF